MRFRQPARDEPEINLIPFIDVLLVVLIFLMLSTTYSKFTELQINLPVANAEAARDRPKEVIVSISGDGRYAFNKTALPHQTVETLTAMLTDAVQVGGKETVLIISADAQTAHQAVVMVMEAARHAGLTRVTFATQTAAQAKGN